jgi:hypothetical protein
MCNKANLLNQSAFLLGVPGSGKSFSAKELITFLILNTNDDIMICDPEGEYAPLIEAMGDLGSVIRVSAGGRDRLNAMYMVDGYGENNPIVVKSEFIMSLIEQIDKKASARSTSLLSTAVSPCVPQCGGHRDDSHSLHPPRYAAGAA